MNAVNNVHFILGSFLLFCEGNFKKIYVWKLHLLTQLAPDSSWGGKIQSSNYYFLNGASFMCIFTRN